MRWGFQSYNAIVDAEIKSLPADMQARFLRFGDIIGQVGFEGLSRHAVKQSKASSGSFASRGATALREQFISPPPAAASLWCGCSSRGRRRRRGMNSNWRARARKVSHDQAERPQGHVAEGPGGAP